MKTDYYLEAPNEPTVEQTKRILTRSIFLGGGITNCWDWQDVATHKLSMVPELFIINPRRSNWDESDTEAGLIQIEWEYNRIAEARQMMFWFSNETVQPISLYELGKELGERKAWSDEGYPWRPLWIGIDPRYKRAFDVREQARLIARDVPIYHDLYGMLDAILAHNMK